MTAVVRAALRLDEDLSLFYRLTDGDPALAWARARGAGRILRAPTAFEDLIRALVIARLGRAKAAPLLDRLCRLGPEAPSGAHAFPTPAELAAAPASFSRRHLGPLAGPLRALSLRCRDELHAEALRKGPAPSPPAPTARELHELLCQAVEWEERLEALLLSLPGFGLRAAELLLPLLGCYDVFLYSSRLRGAWACLGGPGEGPAARRAQLRRLDRGGRYGPYRGLALWLLSQAPPPGAPPPPSRSRARKNSV